MVIKASAENIRGQATSSLVIWLVVYWVTLLDNCSDATPPLLAALGGTSSFSSWSVEGSGTCQGYSQPARSLLASPASYSHCNTTSCKPNQGGGDGGLGGS